MDAVLTAMVEEKIGVGDRNRFLIQTAKEQLRFDYALALRSPAVALHLALKALDVKPGQAVVVSALSPRYYIKVIEDMQLVPLFCDVSFEFPCMNREAIEKVIEEKKEHSQTYAQDSSLSSAPGSAQVCAIVLHHTLGFIPNAAAIAELGIPVIEDISLSYGSWQNPKEKEKNETEKDESSNAAATAAVSQFSGVFCILGLEERDMLTSGGGALLFAMNRRDGSVLRNYAGIPGEYCLPDINAALAIVQFKEVWKNIEKRKSIAGVYNHACLSLAARTKHKRFIPPVEGEYNNYSFSLVLETGYKDVAAYARKKEIEVESAFDGTLAAAGLCEKCPVSNSLVLRTVLFPLYPRLRSQEAERVSKLIMTLP